MLGFSSAVNQMAGDHWEIWRSPIGEKSPRFVGIKKLYGLMMKSPILLVKSCLSCERTTFKKRPRLMLCNAVHVEGSTANLTLVRGQGFFPLGKTCQNW